MPHILPERPGGPEYEEHYYASGHGGREFGKVALGVTGAKVWLGREVCGVVGVEGAQLVGDDDELEQAARGRIVRMYSETMVM